MNAAAPSFKSFSFPSEGLLNDKLEEIEEQMSHEDSSSRDEVKPAREIKLQIEMVKNQQRETLRQKLKRELLNIQTR